MENLMYLFGSFFFGWILCYLYFKMSNKLITQTDRNLILYPPGSGITIKRTTTWKYDPRKRRDDLTAAKALLSDRGIDYTFFRVLKFSEIVENEVVYHEYLFEYWN